MHPEIGTGGDEEGAMFIVMGKKHRVVMVRSLASQAYW